MGVDLSKLLETLGTNEYYMCTGEELAVLMNFSKDVMSRIKSAPNSPFFLGKARPRWIRKWMRRHPNFQLSKADATSIPVKIAKTPKDKMPPASGGKRRNSGKGDV